MHIFDTIFQRLKDSGALQARLPVGSIYGNATDGTNPAELLGYGTWAALAPGRVLIGAGTGNDGTTGRTVAAGETGGEYAHSLTEAENGPHTHNYNLRAASGSPLLTAPATINTSPMPEVATTSSG